MIYPRLGQARSVPQRIAEGGGPIIQAREEVQVEVDVGHIHSFRLWRRIIDARL